MSENSFNVWKKFTIWHAVEGALLFFAFLGSLMSFITGIFLLVFGILNFGMSSPMTVIGLVLLATNIYLPIALYVLFIFSISFHCYKVKFESHEIVYNESWRGFSLYIDDAFYDTCTTRAYNGKNNLKAHIDDYFIEVDPKNRITKVNDRIINKIYLLKKRKVISK